MIRKTLLALAAGALAFAAQASTYTITGSIEDGPLAGDVFSGMFSFDDSQLPATDGWLPLTSLSLTFDGQTYTLDTAVAGTTDVDFDVDNLTPIGVDAVWGTDSQGVTLSNGFGSPYLGDTANNFGSYTIAPAAAVPEPSSWMLALAGLAVMGAVVRRRSSK